MPAQPEPGGSSTSLGERLDSVRRRRFVGRMAELDLFRSLLDAPEPPFALLFVHGPGGVGKTALLGEYARLAHAAGVRALRLDGRDLEPSPPGFLAALGQALGAPPDGAALAALREGPRTILLIDTYEAIAPLDPWLREEFLPRLPERHAIVIAGRTPPAPAWRADPGWQELARIVSLRNLRPEEGRGYLRARGVPADRHDEVLGFTHGHPLALSLVADALAQGDDRVAVVPPDDPDVVRALLERFLEGVPTPAHRLALDACAHVRVTTEPLLAAALGDDEAAHELFAWLRGLSFIEQGPGGLLPHDLARDVLDADLHWRNREAYRRLHHRVRAEIVGRLTGERGQDQQRAMFDLLFLHRRSPVMRPFVEWASLGSAYLAPAGPEDAPFILETIVRHEGADSARIARHWLTRQPEAFVVCRRSGREVIGLCANLVLGEPDELDLAADPAVARAWEFARRHGPIRPGERIVYHRFVLDRDTYQSGAAMNNMAATNCVPYWLATSRLAWSMVAIAEPALWQPMFHYLDFVRAHDADFTIGDVSYGVFAHDWRVRPPAAWLELMGDREIDDDGTAVQPANPPATPPLLVLSRPQFDEAVRQALRDLAHPDRFAGNPLLRSRLVAERGEPGPVALRALIEEAASTLAANPRDAKLERAIRHTYLMPAATQELAADALGLPFGTYRYHLNAGIRRIADQLWHRELHGSR